MERASVGVVVRRVEDARDRGAELGGGDQGTADGVPGRVALLDEVRDELVEQGLAAVLEDPGEGGEPGAHVLRDLAHGPVGVPAALRRQRQHVLNPVVDELVLVPLAELEQPPARERHGRLRVVGGAWTCERRSPSPPTGPGGARPSTPGPASVARPRPGTCERRSPLSSGTCERRSPSPPSRAPRASGSSRLASSSAAIAATCRG